MIKELATSRRARVNVSVTLPQNDGSRGKAAKFVQKFNHLVKMQDFAEQEWDSLLMDCLKKGRFAALWKLQAGIFFLCGLLCGSSHLLWLYINKRWEKILPSLQYDAEWAYKDFLFTFQGDHSTNECTWSFSKYQWLQLPMNVYEQLFLSAQWRVLQHCWQSTKNYKSKPQGCDLLYVFQLVRNIIKIAIKYFSNDQTEKTAT